MGTAGGHADRVQAVEERLGKELTATVRELLNQDFLLYYKLDRGAGRLGVNYGGLPAPATGLVVGGGRIRGV